MAPNLPGKLWHSAAGSVTVQTGFKAYRKLELLLGGGLSGSLSAEVPAVRAMDLEALSGEATTSQVFASPDGLQASEAPVDKEAPGKI